MKKWKRMSLGVWRGPLHFSREGRISQSLPLTWRSLCGDRWWLFYLFAIIGLCFCFCFVLDIRPIPGEIPVELTRSPVKGCAVIWLMPWMPWKPVRTVNFVVHLGRHSCHSNNNLRHSSSQSSCSEQICWECNKGIRVSVFAVTMHTPGLL